VMVKQWNRFIDIIHHESSKGMGQFEDESLTAHCQNTGIVLNVEL